MNPSAPPHACQVLVRGDWVVTLDHERHVYEPGCVAIDGEKISWVGSAELATLIESEVQISRPGCAILPGLINSHTHLFQSLCRGLGDDLDLFRWIRQVVWPFVAAMSPEDLYVGTMLGAIEAVRSGTTSVLENHYALTELDASISVCRAIEQIGLRGVVARGVVGPRTESADATDLPDTLFRFSAGEELSITEECIRATPPGARVRFWPSPLMLTFVDLDLAAATIELARRHGVGWHSHCSEVSEDPLLFRRLHRLAPVEWLHREGLLGSEATLAHGIWLSDSEIELLASAKATVVHNPVSNAYLAAGVMRLRRYLDAGVNVSLGSDGPASNTNQDMLEVMKTCVLIQKAVTRDPLTTTAEESVELSVLGGRRCLGLAAEIGTLAPGWRADLIAVDLAGAHTTPVHRVSSSLVYGASGRDVKLTMVDGVVLFDGEKVRTVDEQAVLGEARTRGLAVAQKAGLNLSGSRWIQRGERVMELSRR